MLNITGIQALLISLVGVGVIIVGFGMVMKSRKAQMSEVAQTSAITFLGLFFVALGVTTGAVMALGDDVLALLRG